MEKEIKLTNGVTSENLLKFGFVKQGSTYVYSKYLYKKSIYAKLYVNIAENSIDYEVIDKCSGNTYFPFYHNINGNGNLVAMTVKDEFDSFIAQLVKNNIVRSPIDETN